MSPAPTSPAPGSPAPTSAARGLSVTEAALAGAGTGLAVLVAEGCAAIATRPSYRAALQYGAPWRIVLVVLPLFALAALLGLGIAAACGARGPARRGLALRASLLVASLVVLVHPWLAPPVVLRSIMPAWAAAASLATPLLLAALLAGGRRALLLPVMTALLAGLLGWLLLGRGVDLPPRGAEADLGWATRSSGTTLLLVIAAAALVAAAPLARALAAAARGPATGALGRAFAAQLLLAAVATWSFGRPAAGAPEAAPASAEHPPVLLIVADTLRADHVTGFGAAPGFTPRLAELARDGTSFGKAWTAAPWTTPSFGSLLTGRLPLDHGLGSGRRGLQSLSPAVPTLAGELSAQGWHSAAVLSNPLLGRQLGLARGFSRYEDVMAPEWYHPVASWLMELTGLAQPYMTAPAQAARALEAIDAAAEDAPSWFVLSHFMDTHWPQHFPAALRAQEPDGLVGDYRAAARAVDAGVGELLDGLRARGLYDSTLIVFTADHGEELEEHRPQSAQLPPTNLHGHTLFEEQLHVPLIVKLPAGDARLGPPGTRRDEPVSLVDLMPTLLETLGISPPPNLAGRSLLEPPLQRPILAEGIRPDRGRQGLAVRQSERKLVGSSVPPIAETTLQYDLARDPGERDPRDVPADDPLLEALRVRCLRLEKSPAAVDPAPEQGLDADTLRQLQQLGYMR